MSAPNDPRPALLRSFLERLARRRGIPHALMAVESLDGSFCWQGGIRADPAAPFFLASITKLYIAAATLRLAEQQRLDLDDPLSAYLPAALIDGLHVHRGHDHTARITLRHLLAHATGLPDSLEERPPGGRSLLERAFEQGDFAWSLEGAIALARNHLTPHFPPQPLDARRARVRYSDTNFQLLMLVIEAVSARPLAEVYDEFFYQPLGLRETRFPNQAGRPCTPVHAGARVLDLPLALASSRDLVAPATEAIAFLRALLTGRAFARPATAALMQGPWRRFGFPFDLAALRAPSWPIEYGLGMMRFRLPRWLTPSGAVPELIGHTGSTGTWLFYCPKLELIFAGAVNDVGAGAVPYQLLPRLLRHLERARFR